MISEADAAAAIAQALEDNLPLLDFPSKDTVQTGTIDGVPVWGPSKSYRRRSKGHKVEQTRAVKMSIRAPAQLLQDIWLSEHSTRGDWDGRTVQSAAAHEVERETHSATKAQTQLVHLVARAKPLISPRDFVYALGPLPTPPDQTPGFVEGESILYGGGSVSAKAGAQFHSRGAVRAWLQGLLRITPTGPHQCEATYLLRCAPAGMIPNYVIKLVANELTFTLFDLKKLAEKRYSRSRL